MVEAVADLTDGIGPDVMIEAVGSIPTYEDSMAAVRRGGKVLAYGAAPMDRSISLRPFDVYAKELTIVASYAGTYDTWAAGDRTALGWHVRPEPHRRLGAAARRSGGRDPRPRARQEHGQGPHSGMKERHQGLVGERHDG
ncbi:hypothetical protein Ari01nite_33960 [Paractinoplanes rishiriensis]|uniref:Alcohol dehydrogenase-like C-terminal domain-containing protein n=1 Tax=Paractinoplanes rishiriensis TaxID=1050105 RepID=A0A919MQA0_9ACTN|nr:hypothetical protein Ari01nite_33960 [Actinoplanes rishiriensis]